MRATSDKPRHRSHRLLDMTPDENQDVRHLMRSMIRYRACSRLRRRSRWSDGSSWSRLNYHNRRNLEHLLVGKSQSRGRSPA